MNKLLVFFLVISSTVTAQRESDAPQNIDSGWKFFRGGVERGYDSLVSDAGWRNVELPHDWSIEDLPGTRSPFDSNAVSALSQDK